MKKMLSDVRWQGVGAIAGILGLLLPLLMPLVSGGSKPRLIIDYKGFAVMPFSSMTGVDVALKVDGQEISDPAVLVFSVVNGGRCAIKPGDFLEPLSVKVKKPWQVAGMASGADSKKDIVGKWIRKGEGEYVLEPLLLNPGEKVHGLMFVSGVNLQNNRIKLGEDVKWDARIAELEPMDVNDVGPDSKDVLRMSLMGVGFQFDGVDVYLYFLLALVLYGLNCWVFFAGPRGRSFSSKWVWLLVGFLCVSAATAEIILFGLRNSAVMWGGCRFVLTFHVALIMVLCCPVGSCRAMLRRAWCAIRDKF